MSEVKVLQARIPVGLTAEAEELKGQEDQPLRSLGQGLAEIGVPGFLSPKIIQHW